MSPRNDRHQTEKCKPWRVWLSTVASTRLRSRQTDLVLCVKRILAATRAEMGCGRREHALILAVSGAGAG